MRASFPIYEGDSIIHHGGALTLPKEVRPASAPAEHSLFAVIGDAIRGLFLWMERSAYRAQCRELERYLADSGDVFELERRIRKLERSYGGTFDPYS